MILLNYFHDFTEVKSREKRGCCQVRDKVVEKLSFTKEKGGRRIE